MVFRETETEEFAILRGQDGKIAVRRNGEPLFVIDAGTPEDMLLAAFNAGKKAGEQAGQRGMARHIIDLIENNLT